ncbi:hypothetical protein EDD16DRAFT_1794909, partial [Pisolithus croceorrhizus]
FNSLPLFRLDTTAKHKCERGLEELIGITQEKVSKKFSSPENTLSAVYLAAAGAQRMLPTLKIELSMEVGRQRYWRALASSANFQSYTMLNCLGVIHTDIVSVWNFYDPDDHLNSKEFRNLMMSMEPRSAPDSGACDPAVCCLRDPGDMGSRNVPAPFMAYIVDLTHVLEILFLHTADARGKKLTRRAIKLAFRAYYDSLWMRNVHTEVRRFESRVGAQDPILEKITSLISSDGAEAEVHAALEGLPPFDPERDEEWDDGQQGC